VYVYNALLCLLLFFSLAALWLYSDPAIQHFAVDTVVNFYFKMLCFYLATFLYLLIGLGGSIYFVDMTKKVNSIHFSVF